jgi:hypothetical protein
MKTTSEWIVGIIIAAAVASLSLSTISYFITIGWGIAKHTLYTLGF